VEVEADAAMTAMTGAVVAAVLRRKDINW